MAHEQVALEPGRGDVPAEDGDKLHAALGFFELPIDSSSVPSVAETGAVSDDETHRPYDMLTQGTRLDDPIVLREP